MAVAKQLGVILFLVTITRIAFLENSALATESTSPRFGKIIRFGEGPYEFWGRSFSLPNGKSFLLLEAMKNGHVDSSFGRDGYLVFPPVLTSSGPPFELETILAGAVHPDGSLSLFFSANHNGREGHTIKLRVDRQGRIWDAANLFRGEANSWPSFALVDRKGRGIVVAEKFEPIQAGRPTLHKPMLGLWKPDRKHPSRDEDDGFFEVIFPKAIQQRHPQIYAAGLEPDGRITLWGSFYELNTDNARPVFRTFQLRSSKDGRESMLREFQLSGVNEAENHYDIEGAHWDPDRRILDLLLQRREFMNHAFRPPVLSTQRYRIREISDLIKADLVFQSDEVEVPEPATGETGLSLALIRELPRHFLEPGELGPGFVIVDPKLQTLERLPEGRGGPESRSFSKSGLLTAEQLTASTCQRVLEGLGVLREEIYTINQ